MASTAHTERSVLHERVRSFVRESLAGRTPCESFDELGLDVARYQARHIEPYARLLASCQADLCAVAAVRDLPAVPTDAFRRTRIAAHSADDDRAVFFTSGTTVLSGGARGAHAFSTTETYDAAALGWGAWGLFPDAPRRLVALVLGPWNCEQSALEQPGNSSLGYMVRRFVETFASEYRVVIDQDGRVDVDAVLSCCERVQRDQIPVALLGTSFAFVHLLDNLRGRRIQLPPCSRAMHTGGYKGRSREVEPAELRREIVRAFALEDNAIVGEYGMTELSSQLYEGCLRRHLGLSAPSGRHGVFCPPPWLRVVAVDPATLLPLPSGSDGLLRFEDLANVDSAIVVQTADRGRVVEEGVELLGRAAGAPARGCSLAADDLLTRRRSDGSDGPSGAGVSGVSGGSDDTK